MWTDVKMKGLYLMRIQKKYIQFVGEKAKKCISSKNSFDDAVLKYLNNDPVLKNIFNKNFVSLTCRP